jgi:predicted deacylase
MTYQDMLLALLPVKGAQAEIYCETRSKGQLYQHIVLHSPGPKLLIITTGFHGDEPAGPLTMVKYLESVFAYAQKRQVGLRVYPCTNPTGFVEQHRYGGDQRQTNYIFQYRLEDGEVTGEPMGKASKPVGVVPREGLPEEVSALALDLSKQPKPDGVLDIHQDGGIKGRAFYLYAYKDKTPYLHLMERLEQAGSHRARSARVSEGGDVTPRSTDRDGFVMDWYDGSFTDWYRLQGVPHVVTLETAATMPLELAIQLNLEAMLEMIDLVATRSAGAGALVGA